MISAVAARIIRLFFPDPDHHSANRKQVLLRVQGTNQAFGSGGLEQTPHHQHLGFLLAVEYLDQFLLGSGRLTIGPPFASMQKFPVYHPGQIWDTDVSFRSVAHFKPVILRFLSNAPARPGLGRAPRGEISGRRGGQVQCPRPRTLRHSQPPNFSTIRLLRDGLPDDWEQLWSDRGGGY